LVLDLLNDGGISAALAGTSEFENELWTWRR